MLDLRRLRLLRELKIRGTLADVAASLNFSPSSVSQQLSQLERETGVRLLRRSGRGVQLTAQAETLVAHTERLLDIIEEAESDLATDGGRIAGTVRVAAFQSAALALLPEALLQMAREFPDVRVEMVQREPETALTETWARDFDMVVAEQYPHHSAPWHDGLVRADLTSDAIRLACPRGLLAEREVRTVAELRDIAWVMEPHGAASRHWAEQLCRSAGFEPDVRYETADLQAHIRLVTSGNAVALLPDLIWSGTETGCALLDLPDDPHRTIFTAVREAGAERPAIGAFRRALESAAEAVTLPRLAHEVELR